MPEISRFLGIIIKMYWKEHNPPHFHAQYGEHEAEIAIQSLALLNGYLPPRVLGLVIEWAEIHQKALEDNWNSMQTSKHYHKIEPLV